MHFNKFTIETDLSKSDIVEKLKTLIYTDKIPLFGFIKTEKYFYGEINENTFSIARVIKGRNSFTPIISGEVFSKEKNTIVIKMRLHFIVLAFIAWVTFLIFRYQLKSFELGGIFFLIVLYGITLYFYIGECEKVKAVFKEKFEETDKAR